MNVASLIFFFFEKHTTHKLVGQSPLNVKLERYGGREFPRLSDPLISSADKDLDNELLFFFLLFHKRQRDLWLSGIVFISVNNCVANPSLELDL